MNITTDNSLLKLIQLIKEKFDGRANDTKSKWVEMNYNIDAQSDWQENTSTDRKRKWYVDIPSTIATPSMYVICDVDSIVTSESDEALLKVVEAGESYVRCYFSAKPQDTVRIKSFLYINTEKLTKNKDLKIFKWSFEKKGENT